MITLTQMDTAHQRCCDGINMLLSHLTLSSGVRPLTIADLREALKNPNFHLFVAEDTEKTCRERYVGMGSIFFQLNLRHWMAEIHDITVDSSYRGKGLGEKIVRELIHTAKRFAHDRKTTMKISLTSRPERIAANTLYLKLGFRLAAKAVKSDEEGLYVTNLYVMTITPEL